MSTEEIVALEMTREELDTLFAMVQLFNVKDLNDPEIYGGFGEGWDGEGARRGCAAADRVHACWKKHFKEEQCQR